MASYSLVIGAAGQDGAILCDYLVGLGSSIVAVTSSSARVVGPGQSSMALPFWTGSEWKELLGKYEIASVYFLAAMHTSSEGSISTVYRRADFDIYLGVNTGIYVALLEAIVESGQFPSIFYASSSKIFGPPAGKACSESTRLAPDSFYAFSKAIGLWIGQKFRQEHSLPIYTGILFNHDSSLRPATFFTQRVIQGAINILEGKQETLEVRNLNFSLDWSYAPDIVRQMVALVRSDRPGDFVIGSGSLFSGHDFCGSVFRNLGLDDYVKHVRQLAPSEELVHGNFADHSRLTSATGYVSRDLEEQVADLVRDAQKSRQ